MWLPVAAGGVSLTTTQGDIEVFDVTAQDNQLLIDAQGIADVDDFDGGLEVIPNRLGGTIILNDPESLPVINEIRWTAYNAPDGEF